MKADKVVCIPQISIGIESLTSPSDEYFEETFENNDIEKL